MITNGRSGREQMANRTRTTITIHTQQRIVVRPSRDSVYAWCDHCLAQVVALTPECVAGVLRITAGPLYERLEYGKWHAVQEDADPPLICGNSLSANLTESEIQIEGEQQ